MIISDGYMKKKLTDFYNKKQVNKVLSVNNETGNVFLTADSLGALSKVQIGSLVPALLNGKIKNNVIPLATERNVGGVIVGDGLTVDQSGKLNILYSLKIKKISEVDQNFQIFFPKNYIIIGVISNKKFYYIQNGDITTYSDKISLHIKRFLIQQQTEFSGQWNIFYFVSEE